MKKATSCSPATGPNPVLSHPALQPQTAVHHFEARLRAETDCSDVHATQHLGDRGFALLDVRSRDLYEAGHLPGALSLPHADISKETLDHVEGHSVFVVYCAGPHCNGAQKAALKIAQLGFTVKEMIGGISGWKQEGFQLVSEMS